jgi:hypothetical protein
MSAPVLFAAGLFAFIFCFGFFIGFVARKLNHRISARLFGVIEKAIIGGILLGIASMFQPWVQDGLQVGFTVLFYSTLAYVVWSHVTPREAQRDLEIDSGSKTA